VAHYEACQSFVHEHYLAAILVCRTLISYIAKYKGYKPAKEEYSSFKKVIEYLTGENLITAYGEEILKKVSSLIGDIAHTPIPVLKVDALIALMYLDIALKDIYFKPNVEDMNLEDWFDTLIREALEEVCYDITTKERVFIALQDANSIFPKMYSKMSKNQDCVKTAQAIMKYKYWLDWPKFNEIIKSEPGVACMNYIKSQLELEGLIGTNAT